MAGLEGRIALITGASQGIGRACAIELARAGATVALAARNQEKLDAVANEIRSSGGNASAFFVGGFAGVSLDVISNGIYDGEAAET